MAIEKPTPSIEWGGMALAGALIGFFCKYLKDITKQHRDERKELVSAIETDHKELKIIIKADIESRTKLIEALEKRPCLLGEGKIKQ